MRTSVAHTAVPAGFTRFPSCTFVSSAVSALCKFRTMAVPDTCVGAALQARPMRNANVCRSRSSARCVHQISFVHLRVLRGFRSLQVQDDGCPRHVCRGGPPGPPHAECERMSLTQQCPLRSPDFLRAPSCPSWFPLFAKLPSLSCSFMFSRRTAWNLAPNRLTLAHQQALRSGNTILDLTLSNPTRAGLAYNESAILNAFHNSKALDYDPQPKGLLAARNAVA